MNDLLREFLADPQLTYLAGRMPALIVALRVLAAAGAVEKGDRTGAGTGTGTEGQDGGLERTAQLERQRFLSRLFHLCHQTTSLPAAETRAAALEVLRDFLTPEDVMLDSNTRHLRTLLQQCSTTFMQVCSDVLVSFYQRLISCRIALIL